MVSVCQLFFCHVIVDLKHSPKGIDLCYYLAEELRNTQGLCYSKKPWTAKQINNFFFHFVPSTIL